MKDPKWMASMNEEYSALLRNHTWTLISLLSNRKAIWCKWVFKNKQNSDGIVNKYKARLVAKGLNQQHVLDFTETFSPVVKHVTIKLL